MLFLVLIILSSPRWVNRCPYAAERVVAFTAEFRSLPKPCRRFGLTLASLDGAIQHLSRRTGSDDTARNLVRRFPLI